MVISGSGLEEFAISEGFRDKDSPLVAPIWSKGSRKNTIRRSLTKMLTLAPSLKRNALKVLVRD